MQGVFSELHGIFFLSKEAFCDALWVFFDAYRAFKPLIVRHWQVRTVLDPLLVATAQQLRPCHLLAQLIDDHADEKEHDSEYEDHQHSTVLCHKSRAGFPCFFQLPPHFCSK